MIRFHRSVCICILLGTLFGCGSVPEQQHEGVEIVNEAMTYGMHAYRDDRYLEARQLFSKGLAHYRSMDDPQGALIAYINLIDVALVTGEFAAARGWLDRAMRLAANEDDSMMRDRLSLQSAHLEWLTLAPSDSLSATSIELLDNMINTSDDNPEIAVSALFLRTQIALRTEDEQSEQWLTQLRDTVSANPGALNVARLARLEAEDAVNNGNFSVAESQLLKAQRYYRTEKYRPGLAAVHEELAVVEEQQGNLQTAVFHAEQALFIRLWITDRHHTEALLRKLTEFETTLGNKARADEYLAMAEFVAASSEIKWNTMRQRLRSGKVN